MTYQSTGRLLTSPGLEKPSSSALLTQTGALHTGSLYRFNNMLIVRVRVYDLKTALRDLTNVPLERQKILGLVKGKLPEDQVLM